MAGLRSRANLATFLVAMVVVLPFHMGCFAPPITGVARSGMSTNGIRFTGKFKTSHDQLVRRTQRFGKKEDELGWAIFGLIPVVGPAVNFVRKASTGQTQEAGIEAGMFVLDVCTLGTASEAVKLSGKAAEAAFKAAETAALAKKAAELQTSSNIVNGIAMGLSMTNVEAKVGKCNSDVNQ